MTNGNQLEIEGCDGYAEQSWNYPNY